MGTHADIPTCYDMNTTLIIIIVSIIVIIIVVIIIFITYQVKVEMA